jgi:predicted metal-binding membrane protein
MSSSAATVPASTLELLLRRDRHLVVAGLVLVAALSWLYMFRLAFQMSDMAMSTTGAEMAMPQMQSWGLVDFVLMFVMWAVMMVAMMVPSAAPMVLLYARLNRKRREREAPYAPTALFLGGYLLAWTGFSAVATFAQWVLHNAALLTPMGMTTSAILGGALLVSAGLFQLTPLKKACLVHCRSPLHFFMQEWREGSWGALSMGVRHGVYCVGCCWVLMALLFVAGVMNLLWVAAITIFVLVERVMPNGDLVGRVAGVVLIGAGLTVVAVGWA